MRRKFNEPTPQGNEDDQEDNPSLLQVAQGTVRQASQMISDAGLRRLRDKLESDAYESLNVVVQKNGRAFGFGERIVIPGNQLHVVTGHGWHNHPIFLNTRTEVFGHKSASKKSVYWVNALTEIIPLSTTVFIVPVAGPDGIGVDVLDRDNKPYNVTAHVTAKLDPEKAQDAAASIGTNVKLLIANIQEVAEAELIHAATVHA